MAAAMQDELFRRARAEGSKHSPYAKKEVADFGKIYHQLRWDIGFVGVQVGPGDMQLHVCVGFGSQTLPTMNCRLLGTQCSI